MAVIELYTESERSRQQFAFGPVDYFVEEMGEFVRGVEAEERPAITVRDGYGVDSIIDALYRSGDAQERISLQ